MNNKSVWFEQVDGALLEYLPTVIRIPDQRGVDVSVPAKIRKPDEDYNKETYPTLLFFSTGFSKDIIRDFPDTIVTSRNYTAHTLTRERGAVPFTLFYQVEFWSKLQTQMNDMLRVWLAKHPDSIINLDVKDMSGDTQNCFVRIDPFIAKTDMVNGKDRFFRSIVSLSVWVELDEQSAEEVSMITQPIILISE